MAYNRKFTIAEQFDKYLQLIGLQKEKMHPEQFKQTRQAFYGACGQLLILQRDEISELPEDDGCEVLNSMMNEVGNFWIQQTNRKN